MARRTDINYSPEAVTRRLKILRHIVSGSEHGCQLEFARRVSIGVNTWGNYERGFPISVPMAIDLCMNYPHYISMDYILFGDTRLLQQYLLERIADAETVILQGDYKQGSFSKNTNVRQQSHPDRKRKLRARSRK